MSASPDDRSRGRAGPGVFAVAAAERGDDLVEWFAPTEPPPGDALDGYDGAVVLGGAMSPDQEAEHSWLRPEKELIGALRERGVPLLGICLGAELVSEAAGGGSGRTPHLTSAGRRRA